VVTGTSFGTRRTWSGSAEMRSEGKLWRGRLAAVSHGTGGELCEAGDIGEGGNYVWFVYPGATSSPVPTQIPALEASDLFGKYMT